MSNLVVVKQGEKQNKKRNSMSNEVFYNYLAFFKVKFDFRHYVAKIETKLDSIALNPIIHFVSLI